MTLCQNCGHDIFLGGIDADNTWKHKIRMSSADCLVLLNKKLREYCGCSNPVPKVEK